MAPVESQAADYRPGVDAFDPPDPPFGEETVCIDVVGLQAELSGLDADLAEQLRRRYGAFLAPGKPGPEAARIRVARSPREGFLAWRPGQDPTHRLETAWEGRLLVWSYGFAALYDPRKRQGVLALSPEPPEGRALVFENFLRVVYSWLALQEGGFLFHSSALVPEDGRARLFFGPSGAGKTTCCRLSEGIARPVNDDLVLLHPEGGSWQAAAVPFTGIFGREEAGNSYPVAALYRLVQAPEHRVETLSPATAVVEVLSSVPFMEERPTDGALADRVAELVGSVPVRRLHFKKDPGFWQTLRDEEPGGERS